MRGRNEGERIDALWKFLSVPRLPEAVRGIPFKAKTSEFLKKF